MGWPWRRARHQASGRLRIVVASDIHGSDLCWKKFLAAGQFYRADVLVLAGDVTGKALVPLVEEARGAYRARFMGADELVSGADLDALESRIRFNGFYPHRCSPEEAERLRVDPAARERIFTSAMKTTAEHWIELADDRLRGSAVRCLVMPGNDDEPFVDAVLASSETIENHDGRVVQLDGYRIIGHGWSNETPWRTPREKPDAEIEADLSALLDGAGPGDPIILNPHVPPYGSRLDLAPELRSDFSLVTTAGQARMIPVGSRGVAAVIERYQPFLSLHGHIHESRGVVRLGATTAVNPGSEYNVGRLLGAIVDVERGQVRNVQLVAG